VDVLQVERSADGAVTLAATPSQPGTPTRDHVLQVAAYTDDGGALRRTDAVQVHLTGPRTVVPGMRLADAALVLVNGGDHAYAKVRPDRSSLGVMLERLADIDDALARSTCWSTLHELVRDGALPARAFLRAVAEHGPHEEDQDTSARLLHLAVTVSDEHTARADRDSLRALLADRAWHALTDSSPDSDRARVWATAWVELVGEAGHALLRRALENDWSIAGVALDDELAWHALAALARAGHVDPEHLASRQRLDPSDETRRRCLQVLAARPLPEAKDEAWWAVLHDADLREADRLAIARGIHQPVQDEVLQPLAKAYFAELPGIWAGRPVDQALSLTRSLFPRYASDPSVPDLADEVATGLPPVGRRVLVEGADNLRRAARARGCDESAAREELRHASRTAASSTEGPRSPGPRW
jgi:aminopeptidase N